MATYWTRTLIPTLRQDPAEAEVPSHRLMLRAGLIRQLSAGLYTYLPLGWRALHKAIQIVREEMDAAGAAEMFMPAIEPIELLAQTKREIEYGPDLFRFEDRRGHVNALAPTHEEVITEAMRAYVESYRQLPLNLYQIQTKFRDEPRPRFGVLRCREFIMKDAYSFHLTVDGPGGLDETYRCMYDAYCRIFDRCGLSYEIVEAESGPIGGSASHEFMVICDTGEDTILKSDKGNYSANVHKCAIDKRPVAAFLSKGPAVRDTPIPDKEPTGDLEEVYTPNCMTIEALCESWPKFGGGKLKPTNVLKTLVYKGPARSIGASEETYDWVIAVVRGDHQVNEAKLRQLCGDQLTFADDRGTEAADFSFGYLGPHIANRMSKFWIVVDPDALQDQFWVTGANRQEYHVRHFHWKRDLFENLEQVDWFRKHPASGFTPQDIRNAADGDPSPIGDGGVLRAHKGIEVGHVFKLGTKYSDAMGFTVLDENQKQRPVIMGCYGIG
ncbi:MAG: proline--tRNA ligase, partial [Planctomycetes bacterium]|nr:proline--tRNA ligase [Planctomycetota bacterium]